MNRIILVVLMVVAIAGCASKPDDSRSVATMKKAVSILYDGIHYAAPIAAGVVAIYGDQDAKDAMQMARESLASLDNVVAAVKSSDDLTKLSNLYGVLQAVWGGIDAGWKGDSAMKEKLRAAVAALEFLKADPAPVPIR